MMDKIKKIVREQTGETLLEIVLSLSLFAIMVFMIATMFVSANKTSIKNLATERQLDKAITSIVKETGENAERKIELQIQFEMNYEDGHVDFIEQKIERIEKGNLEKFVE